MRVPSSLIAILVGVGCSGTPAERPALVVASDLSNPPFATVDETGIPYGFEVAMVDELARRLGRSVEMRRLEFPDLLGAAEAGSVDMACATLGITPERRERVSFSTPYYETEIAVVFRAGPGAPAGLADFARLRVRASRGTTSERAVRQLLPGAEAILEAKSEVSVAEQLAAGEIDAAAMDGPDARRLVAASDGRLTRLRLTGEQYALALPRERTALLVEVDRALEEMRRDGTLARLLREHRIEPSE